MQSPAPDPRHFVRAVTQLGERRPVVSRVPIYNALGLKVLDKGIAVDARLYDRLVQHQLKTPLAESLESEPGLSSATLREEALALCQHDRLCAAMRASLRDADLLFDELALLPLPRPVAFQLMVMREVRPELWQHSLRSAFTAAWLGVRTGGSRYDVRMLAAAGLLHDIGMLHLDPVLLAPGRPLGSEQRRQLYAHPLVSVMWLEQHHEYPKELLQAVMQHHESLDGSGYPRTLSGADISPWGRVLAITELVTALSVADAQTPALRLSLVLRMNARRYDPLLVREVLRLLQPLREPLPAPLPGNPVLALRDIDHLLSAWRPATMDLPALTAARRTVADRVAEDCETERRALADSGAATSQLDALGSGELDAEMAGELSLIAREAAWQLRAVARQARRRWRLAAEEAFPAPVQAWLDETEALCGRLLAEQTSAGEPSDA